MQVKLTLFAKERQSRRSQPVLLRFKQQNIQSSCGFRLHYWMSAIKLALPLDPSSQEQEPIALELMLLETHLCGLVAPGTSQKSFNLWLVSRSFLQASASAPQGAFCNQEASSQHRSSWSRSTSENAKQGGRHLEFYGSF